MPAKALVFDVDNTLTPPRTPLREEMAEALKGLVVPFHLAAGSDLQLVAEQVMEPLARFGFTGTFDAFVCNGADRYRCVLSAGSIRVHQLFRFELRAHLGEEAYRRLRNELLQVLQQPEFSLEGTGITISGEQVIERGSMINVVPMGRPEKMSQEAYAQRAQFVDFDRRTGYRLRLLERLRELVSPWRESHGLRVTLGGQTSFDVVVEGFDKRYPLRTLLEEGTEGILYFGDALHPEGNDRAVLEFIATWTKPGVCPVEAVAVENWQETRRKLLELGLVRLDSGRRDGLPRD